MLAGIQRILALNSTTTTAGQRRMRVLVCTPSHTAANVVTKRLGQFLKPTQLFRLLDASRPISTVPNDLLPFYRQDPITGAFCLPSAQELLSFDVIVSTCLDAHLLYLAGCTNQQLRIHRTTIYRTAQQHLKACGITLGSSGDGMTTTATTVPRQIEQFPHFTHLFLDEAAQATEAESLIPISVVADTVIPVQKAEVILVGDPRQLSPQVFCESAVQAGWGYSWMERLLRRPNIECTGGGHATLLGTTNPSTMDNLLKYSFQYNQEQNVLTIFLTLNYRGHASFLALPSALFYSDLLQSAPPPPPLAITTSSSTNNNNNNYNNNNSEGGGGMNKKKKLAPMEWLDQLRRIEFLSTPVRFPQPRDEKDSHATCNKKNDEDTTTTTTASTATTMENWEQQQQQQKQLLLTPRKQFGFPIHFRGVRMSQICLWSKCVTLD